MKNDFLTIMNFCKKNNLCLNTKSRRILEEINLDDDNEVMRAIEIINNADSLMYPDEIMNYVRQNMGLEKWDNSKDEIIFKMSKNEVFDKVCEWNGLFGYSETLRQWLKDIYGIKL